MAGQGRQKRKPAATNVNRDSPSKNEKKRREGKQPKLSFKGRVPRLRIRPLQVQKDGPASEFDSGFRVSGFGLE